MVISKISKTKEAIKLDRCAICDLWLNYPHFFAAADIHETTKAMENF
jgi:hypothetical protein